MSVARSHQEGDKYAQRWARQDSSPVRTLWECYARPTPCQASGRRDVIVGGFNALPGVTCQQPQGTFYVFPNIKAQRKSSNEVANSLLESAGDALLIGSAFGKHGEGYLRLSYANSVENIERVLERMGAVLERSAQRSAWC